MRSPRKTYAEEIRRNASEEGRFVDMTARVRVWRWNASGTAAEPGQLLPHIYGGIWDRWRGCYVGLGKSPHEFRIHAGQARMFAAFDDPTAQRVLAVAAPGSGKTEGATAVTACLLLWHAGKPGGIVSPTQPKQKIVWKKLLSILPKAWVDAVRPGDGEILLANGSLAQFVSAKRQSAATGSPIAGFDWAWAFEDEQQDIDEESLEEVNARGRIAADYRVFSTATNEARGYLQRRITEYEGHENRRIIRIAASENVFVPREHWARIKAQTDPETWRRRYLAEDVPVDGRVYPAFSSAENIRQVPKPSQVGRSSNITGDLTLDKYGEHYDYVVGVDFGVRTSASVILQCHRPAPASGLGLADRQWWVLGEVVTEHKTNDFHARELLKWFAERGLDATDFVAIKGTDNNSLDKDKSDSVLFKRAGINIVSAAPGRRLHVGHRYSVVNALLNAADGKRRLFLDCDEHKRVFAKKVHDSFTQLMLNASDRAESHGKGTRGEDLTHYTDALGYAVFPFEKFRGTPPPTQDSDGTGDPQRRRAR